MKTINKAVATSRFGFCKMFFSAAASILLFAGFNQTWAQDAYPTKDIQLIIPFAPGGGVDQFGRTVARVLNDEKMIKWVVRVGDAFKR